MTYAEYELGYYMGDSEDYSGPPEDPETQAMLELQKATLWLYVQTA